MATLQKERLEILNKWMNSSTLDSELKKELESLNEEELFDAFYCDLEFGTGGMRGVIGAGTNRMNIYMLRSANFGFGKYLLANAKHPTCVIAYDSRRKSLDFAKESARVLATMGLRRICSKTPRRMRRLAAEDILLLAFLFSCSVVQLFS